MYEQISVAVAFLCGIIKTNSKYSEEKLQNFNANLLKSLVQRYENHWYPDQPSKGQAYRCIRINTQAPRDPILERAATDCGLSYECLKLPLELTVWIDPDEISYRIGENWGSCATLASFSHEEDVTTSSEQLKKAGAMETKLEISGLSIRNTDLANGRSWNCQSGGSQKQCTSGPSHKNKIRLPAFSSVLAKHDASQLAKTVSSSRPPPPTNYGTSCSEYGYVQAMLEV